MELPVDLNARLKKAAEGSGRLTVIGAGGAETTAWSEVHLRSEAAASWMRSREVNPGCSILLLGHTSLEMIIAIRAAWMAGVAVAVASPPSRGQSEHVLRQRFDLMRSTVVPSLILGDSDDLAKLASVPDPHVMDFDAWSRECQSVPSSALTVEDHFNGETLAIIQLTSGTTGTPKAVLVPRRCLDANQAAMARGIGLVDSDRFVSWLPLSHDMGLIGTLGIPMISGVDLVIADPGTFVAEPTKWMEWCSEYGGTITCGPNSTFGIAGQFLERRSNVDLSTLRLAINGSEAIDVDVFEGFLKAGERHGLAPEAAFPVYGLAEATLAVTFPNLGSGLQFDRVDKADLGAGRAVALESGARGEKRLAKLGAPVTGMALDVRLEGRSLVNREVGEIHVKGESVTPGYLGDPHPIGGGWLPTGDLGYLAEGDLVVCGRSKDVVIVAGRNIFPEDIERVTSVIDGIWRGHVAAFGVTVGGRERLVVVVESAVSDHSSIARVVSSTVLDWAGVSVSDVRVVEPRSLPKTASGKRSRSYCRDLYLAGQL